MVRILILLDSGNFDFHNTTMPPMTASEAIRIIKIQVSIFEFIDIDYDELNWFGY